MYYVYMHLNFRDILISKNTQGSNFVKISPSVSELNHADGRTELTDRHDEAVIRFSQFCERAFNVYFRRCSLFPSLAVLCMCNSGLR